jgi:hypothetical protein
MSDNIIHALKYAKDFRIQHSGITVDGHVVTTKECVDYQIKQGTLLLHFDGNWIFRRTKKASGWYQTRKTPTVHVTMTTAGF